MNCRDVREVADSFLGEELLTETNHEILRHLENCPTCRTEIDARRRLRGASSTGRSMLEVSRINSCSSLGPRDAIATAVPAAESDTKLLWISYFARPRRLPNERCADSCPLPTRAAVRRQRVAAMSAFLP